MPVIVVGADTPHGEAIMDALLPRNGEVRAFVTSPQAAVALKERGVKVAIGDVSDGSHVGGAALNAFCAVLVAEAATDDRERSFAADPKEVLAAWVEGLDDAAVTRAIFVGPAESVAASSAAVAAESVVVDPAGSISREIAARVAQLEDAAELPLDQ